MHAFQTYETNRGEVPYNIIKYNYSIDFAKLHSIISNIIFCTKNNI